MSDLLERAKQMPSSLNDACRTIDLMAAEIERLREQLAKARETLKDFIDIVDRAQSGFISGSRSDLDWEKGRDDRVRAARLLLTDEQREGQS